MNSGGDGQAAPTPRKQRRRRLSRRRFWRRVVWSVLLAAVIALGFGPTMRFLGYWPRHHAEVTMEWDVVKIAPDRRSVVIRVNECGTSYAGTHVTRVGANVQLTVSTRADDTTGKISCAVFHRMPTHVVHFHFAMPPSGHVLASGCPKTECDDEAT